jgi:FolB domain-containing protein
MIIKIKNLRLKTVIGIFDWESNVDREIIINVEISSNSLKGLHSDNISDAIDYDQLISKIKNLVASNRFKLVEKLAQTLMDEILTDKRISRCKLEIDKVGAVENVDSFSVIIEQENRNG